MAGFAATSEGNTFPDTDQIGDWSRMKDLLNDHGCSLPYTELKANFVTGSTDYTETADPFDANVIASYEMQFNTTGIPISMIGYKIVIGPTGCWKQSGE